MGLTLLSGSALSGYRVPMRAKSRFLVTFAVSSLVIAGLAACDPGTTPTPTPVKTSVAETPTPTPSASPTVPAVAVAARIQLDGDSVSVEAADESTIVDIPFTTDAATAATQLGTAIGLPATITTTPGDNSCAADMTHYTWGGFELRAPGGYSLAPGAVFLARVQAPTTSNGLPVGMPSGHGVGTPTVDVLAANPGVATEGDPAGDSVVYFDVLSGHPLGDMDTFYGAAAYANGGFITSMVSPIFYYYDC